MSQPPKQKRRSLREALAFFFSTDLSNIEWYQSGCTKIPVIATEDWYSQSKTNIESRRLSKHMANISVLMLPELAINMCESHSGSLP